MRERDTLETCPATTVLGVALGGETAAILERAARAVPTADVITCDLKAAATRVAELWPFAIVVNEDVYAFDPAEFSALARDVGARLITIESTPPPEAELGELLVEAFRRRME